MDDQKVVDKKPKTVSSKKRFQFQWLDDNPSWRTWVKHVVNDPSKFFCQACQITLVCGLSEIKKHSERENHLKNMKDLGLDSDSNNPINRVFPTETVIKVNPFSNPEECFKKRVKIAETKLANFFVEKNLPFSISSDLLSLLKDIGKEPGILQAMTLRKTILRQKAKDLENQEKRKKERMIIQEIKRNYSNWKREDEDNWLGNNYLQRQGKSTQDEINRQHN